MTNKTYEDGVRDGQLEALEKISGEHKARLDSHSKRLRGLERVMWIMLGALTTIQIVIPIFQKFFN